MNNGDVSVRDLCHTRSISAHLPRARPQGFEGVVLILLTAFSTQAYADINFGGAATASYEYNTNVFALPAGETAPGASRRSDWFQAYGGTLEANDLFGQDKLYATITGKDFRYDYFTDLDHVEYTLDGGLTWKSGSNIDGKFDVSRVRSMVPFAQLSQTEISILTEQKETGQIGWLFTPDWRIQGTAYYDTLDQPLVGAPSLSLAQTSGQLALQYVGLKGLTAGISGTHLSGRFGDSNSATNPNFDQETLEFVTKYKPTAASSFDGQVGYSRRTSQSLANTSSGVTGHLGFTDQLSPKTSVYVTLERDIINYITNTGSSLNTSAYGGVTWQATYRIAVNLDYGYTKSLLPDQGIAPNTTRIDHFQFYRLKIDYQPFKWLWIQPYIRGQYRHSNYAPAVFDASVYGVNFNVLWHCPTNRCT
jgi:hypothetical protein